MSKLSTLASVTREDLSKLTVRELRELSKGVIQGYSKYKKHELIKELLVKGVELRGITDNLSPIEAAKQVGLTSEKLGNYCGSLFIRFKQTVESNIDSVTGQVSPKAFGHLSGLALDLIQYLDSIEGQQSDGGIATTTKLRYKSEILKSLREAVKEQKGSLYYNALDSSLTFLKSCLDTAMADASKAKKNFYTQNLSVREDDKTTIKIEPLLEFAEYYLSNLETLKKTNWKHVSIAIAIATGRRMAEIHNPNTVFTVDGDGLQFEGQLKARGLADEYYEKNPSYLIPSLVAPELVVAGHQWLIDQGKTEEVTKKANNRFSRYLSETVKALGESLEVRPLKKFTYKALRSIYSLECVRRRNPNNPEKYMALILGHGRGSLMTQGNKFITDVVTPQSYKADWELVD